MERKLDHDDYIQAKANVEVLTRRQIYEVWGKWLKNL